MEPENLHSEISHSVPNEDNHRTNQTSIIDLGNVMSLWMAQNEICGGTHADFAEHLLLYHATHCWQYSGLGKNQEAFTAPYSAAEYQPKEVRTSPCVADLNTQQSNTISPVVKLEPSANQADKEQVPVQIPPASTLTRQSNASDVAQTHGTEHPSPSDCAPLLPDNHLHGKELSSSHHQSEDRPDSSEKQPESLDGLLKSKKKSKRKVRKLPMCSLCGKAFRKLEDNDSHMNGKSELKPVCSDCSDDNHWTNEASIIDIGDVMDLWMAQNEICGGTHADFAEHLLLYHATHCWQYSGLGKNQEAFTAPYSAAEYQPKEERTSPCVDDLNTQQSNTISPVVKVETSPMLIDTEQAPVQTLAVSTSTNQSNASNIALKHSSENQSHSKPSSPLHGKKHLPDKELTSLQQKTKDKPNPQEKEPESVDEFPKTKKKTKRRARKLHVCAFCSKVFRKLLDFDMHMSTHTQVKPYICADCGKNFSKSSSLKTHMMTHSGEKPHVCAVCGRRFNRISGLRSHMMTHSGAKFCVCSDCGKGFTTDQDLKTHMISHTGEKPYMCYECGRGFNKQEELVQHTIAHADVKPQVCPTCGKSFNNMTGLNKHMKTHTADKPHACTECDKRFFEVTKLKRHMLTHTGEKFYFCSECDKGFSMLSNLKRHIKTHTGEKSHVCSICNKGFYQVGNLKAHMMTHTKHKQLV